MTVVCAVQLAREAQVDDVTDVQAERELIGQCLAGNRDATERFQKQYGEQIYAYPIRVYHMAAEHAGDFYVFAFDHGRIFRRLRTFEGRVPLRAYLGGCVLDHLVLEWKRGVRDIETVSLDSLASLPAEESIETADDMSHRAPFALLAQLDAGKAVVLKLLYIEDCDLEPADIRQLARESGRSVPDMINAVERLRAIVREREAGLKQIEDGLEGVQAWVHLYEGRLQRIADDLAALAPTSTAAARLREERAAVQKRLLRRHQQRSKLLAHSRRRKVTAPYKDIAELLNTSIGNVASRIARVRQALVRMASSDLERQSSCT